MGAYTIILMVLATLFGAIGSVFLKMGVKDNKKFIYVFTKPKIYFGFLLFFVAFLIYVALLKRTDVSYLFPITSLTYIWALILSKKFLRENVDKTRWVGVILIILGILILSF